MEPMIHKVYVLAVEEPGDDILTPQGIVIVMFNLRFTVYSTGANHNLFRSVVHKYPWDQLEQGVYFRNQGFRATDVTDVVDQLGLKKASDSSAILRHLYESNQRQFYFLQRYVALMNSGLNF
ncbi:MAG: hypothetical protein A2201_04795 [Alicyclobacillus sp. RIFOXYA1_FULL_53_8]|nr:MAG: hypothetical protein A2201_04795 [Alicyclobacillus sp. RIFOXYA1_FULL_53_8]